eukprot:m.513649 g.513649  ORF g.513649 m.513649 type:complete len:81 (-) comp111330_c0_seq1:20-262(-)
MMRCSVLLYRVVLCCCGVAYVVVSRVVRRCVVLCCDVLRDVALCVVLCCGVACFMLLFLATCPPQRAVSIACQRFGDNDL